MSDQMIRVDGGYGVLESNTLTDEHVRIREAIAERVDLGDRRLRRIVRLRLVSDPGFPMWDLSYCWGQLDDGTYVDVRLPQWQFSKRALKRDLVEMCKQAGVYGKGLGMFDVDVISRLV